MTGPVLYGDPIDPNEPYVIPADDVALPYVAPNYAAPNYPGPNYPASAYGAPAYGERPGEAVVAAVLALGTAALLLITGFVVIFAASSFTTDDDASSPQHATLFVLAGLINVVAASLLIVGGALLLGRSASSRGTIASGTLLCMALGIFWLASDQGDNGVVVWLIIFCAPAITATILAATTRVTDWLRTGAIG